MNPAFKMPVLKLTILALLLMPLSLFAQINVTTNLTAQQMVQQLVGPNVAILNPVLTCPDGHSGTFQTVSSNIGMPGGIVLSTGDAKTGPGVTGVDGPNQSFITNSSNAPGDAQLSALVNKPTFTACVLEFDFVPDVDSISTLRFKYVFGSEEYPNFTCDIFNDVFGFLISTNSNPIPVNIALVPGTNIPVAINSINSGVPSQPGNLPVCQAMGPGSPFPQYFVNNQAVNGQTITLDGFTTLLEATAVVSPCDTYHMKLGIANAFDAGLQSAVFLQANSFTVDTVTLDLSGIIKSDDGYLVEGCTPGDIVATRTQATSQKKKICLEYSGTAINGLDYTFLPDTLVIPPYGTSASLTLNPLQDNVPEPGFETVKIIRVNCCTKTPIDSITIQLRDSLKLDLISDDTLLCGRDSIHLQAIGDDAFTYLWTANVSPTQANIYNPTLPFAVAFPDTTATFTITATFKSCPPVSKSFLGVVEPLPIINISPKDSTVCLRDSMTIHVTVGPAYFNQFVYNWSPDANLSDKFAKEPKFFAQDVHDYVYVLAVQTPHGCTSRDTTIIRARTPVNLTDITEDTTILYGNSVQLNANGAAFYFWTPGNSLTDPNSYGPVASPLEPTMYTVYGVSLYGCRDTAQVMVDINYNMGEFIPNAFSPNGDGLNDRFKIFNLRFQRLVEMRVFNRWGEEVFATTDAERGWDGSFKGVPQDPATFNYLIRIARPDGQVRTYKGDVILVR